MTDDVIETTTTDSVTPTPLDSAKEKAFQRVARAVQRLSPADRRDVLNAAWVLFDAPAMPTRQRYARLAGQKRRKARGRLIGEAHD